MSGALEESLVSLTIHPSGGDDHALLASDFIKQLDGLRQLLTFAASGGDVDARILRLQMNSPATVVLEAYRADEPSPVNVRSLFQGIKDVAIGGIAPPGFSRPVFEALREFAGAIGKTVKTAVLEAAGETIVIDVEARRRIEAVFGSDVVADGSVDGMLEAINIHSKTNTFALYPVVGPSRITCKFPDELLPSVKPALGRYVLVFGELRYRWRDPHPYEARANRIEILPNFEDQPRFSDILGIAPHATSDMRSEEFVRNIRNGWH